MIISIFLVAFSNVDSSEIITLPLVALLFADDTDLHVVNSGSNSIEEVVMKAQRLLDT